MNVTCPQCRTVYRLPDEKAKAGVKLRCSVCRHVFALPAEEPAEEPLSFKFQETPDLLIGCVIFEMQLFGQLNLLFRVQE